MMKKLLFIALAAVSASAFVGCAPTTTETEANVEATTDEATTDDVATEADSADANTDSEASTSDNE